MRQRVKEVTTRDYIDAETTLGYVLLFIPNEAVYGFVHENDPGLVDAALAQGVVLCSPFTLFAVLGVVRQAVETVQLQRTSDEILRCLGSFTTQWTKFSDSLDTLGKRFESAQKAYDEVAGTRRRVLQKSLDEVDRLRESREPTPTGRPVAIAAPVAAAGADHDHDHHHDHGDDDHELDLSPGDELDDGIGQLAVGAEHDGSPAGHPAARVPALTRVPRLRPIRGR